MAEILEKEFNEGVSAYPTGDCPYPSISGLSNKRYSWWMGFYHNRISKFDHIKEKEPSEKLTVDLTNRVTKEKKR